jgi:O-antigen/teichoic acid export membrane protein
MKTPISLTKLFFSNSFVKEMMYYGSGKILLGILSLVTFSIITHYLTTEEYGIFNSLTSLCGWVILLISFGGSGPMTRYFVLSNNDFEKKRVISSWIGGMLLIMLFVISITYFGKEFIANSLLHNSGLSWTLLLILILCILTFSVDLLAQILRFDLKAKEFSILQVTQAILAAVLSIAFLITGLKIKGLVLGGLMAGLVLLPFYVLYVRKHLELAFHLTIFWKLLKYGLPLVPASAMWIGLSSIDRIMLLRHSANNAGIYTAAFKLVMPVTLVYTIFGMVWSPRAFQVFKKNPSKAPYVYGKMFYIYLFSLIIASISISAFAKNLFLVLTPESYWLASGLVGILSISVICDGSTYITQLGLAIKEKTKFMIIPPLVGFSLNILLNSFFIPIWGYYGAAIASAIAYISLALSYFIIGQKVYPIIVDKKFVLLFMLFVCTIFGFTYLSNLKTNTTILRLLLLCTFLTTMFFANLFPIHELKMLSKTPQLT